MQNNRTVIFNYDTGMKDFFLEYQSGVEGTVTDMTEEQLRDYFQNDSYIALASALTGIPESEFLEYAVSFYKK